MRVLLLGAQPTLLVERRDHCAMRLGDCQPLEPLPGLGRHPPVLADHRDLLETVRAADLEVVGVVTGCDLQGSGPELRVNVLVRDDRQAATDERKHAVPAHEVAVPLVVGIHRDRGVGEHRLGPDGGDGEDLVDPSTG